MHIRTILSFALAAALLASCQPAQEQPRIDVCDIPKRAKSLVGKKIVAMGWYSGGYHDALIAAADCKYLRLVPTFASGTKASFADPNDKWQSNLNADLSMGIWPPVDFYGHFRGVLREKSDGLSQKGQRLSHYELEVDRIDQVRWENAPFIDLPPPCDARCRTEIDNEIRADQAPAGEKGKIAR